MIFFKVLLLCAAGVFAQAQEGGDAVPGPVDERSLILGESPEEADNAMVSPLSSFGVWDFLRMILVLAMVIGVLCGIFHFIKKAGLPRDNGIRFIRVLETRPLAANRHLHLVEVGNHILLVGSAEHGVSLVSEVSDKETADGIRLEASAIHPREGSFADLLKGFFRRRGGSSLPPGGEEEEGGSGGSLDFVKKQKERLKKLL
jgi:flagellar protein FliO/FliZ